MKNKNLSIEEIEKMSYYDFMSYLGTPFYQLGGAKATEELAGMCGIDKDKKVLTAGCGSGFSTCYIAKRFGCHVTGVDLSAESIANAVERAKNEGLQDKTDFIVGDIYDLPFDDGTFDAVITEFVSHFLDPGRAFGEFARVLKPGGFLGINELYREENIPSKEWEELEYAVKTFRELTELPLELYTVGEWEASFRRAGLKNIKIIKKQDYKDLKEVFRMIGDMGGFIKLMGILVNMMKYMFASKKIREMFKKINEGKNILLRKKSTSKYIGYILAVGS